jgi:nitrate reductase NapAB chaperone NapD
MGTDPTKGLTGSKCADTLKSTASPPEIRLNRFHRICFQAVATVFFLIVEERDPRMPIFSYLAYPVQGQKEKLAAALADLKHCSVLAADRKEVLILVTDTPDDDAEKVLQDRLKALDALQSLSMTFGHRDE